MVVSFALDGEFRKIYGRWTPINWESSSLGINLTEKEFETKVAAFITNYEEDLSIPVSKNGVDAKTCFVPTRHPDGQRFLEMKGCVTILKEDSENSGMFVEHILDLQ